MTEDIDEFIAQQKSRLARERQVLQEQNTEKVYKDIQSDHQEERQRQASPLQGDRKINQNGGSSLFGQDDIQAKLRRERQLEYAQFLKDKESRSVQKRLVSEGDGMSLPIKDRASAKARAENQRNQEYRAFMKNKDLKERQRKEERRGYHTRDQNSQRKEEWRGYHTRDQNSHEKYQPVYENRREMDVQPVRKEAACQTPHPPPEYDDSRPPRPPRRGWGSPGPDYDDLLRRKREEEARYRRYDDMDYYPARIGLRPSRSDPRLDRYPDEDNGRIRDYENRDTERRRVRFTDLETQGNDRIYFSDRPHHPPQDKPDDQIRQRDNFGVTRSRTLPEMERNSPQANQRAKSASALQKEQEFMIGNRESYSASQRKKELYSKALAEQIQEQKQAKQREKERERQEELRMVSQTAPYSTNERRNAVASEKPQPNIQPPAVQPYGHSFLNDPYTAQSQGSPNQYAINSAVPPINIPTSVVNNPLPPPNLGLSDPRLLPGQTQIGNLGLDQAYAKSRPTMLNQPFSLVGETSLGQTIDPYMYYKLRNPLEPDPHYNTQPVTSFQPNPTLMSSPGSMDKNGIIPGHLIPGHLIPGQQVSSYNQVPVRNSGTVLRGESAIKNYVGDSNLSPRALQDPRSYQTQLLQQMKENEMKKILEKQAKAKYDAKLEAEAQSYNPWGKGGGGAPMKNAQGQVFADLKQLHSMNEQVLMDPKTPVSLYAEAPPGPSSIAAPTGLARAMAERGMNPPPDQPPGNGKASETVPQQGNPNSDDSYQEQLRQQVEEKKKREAEEKEKIRIEEEKEERRLAEQRENMKREFEKELEAKRKKEGEKLQQEAEMQTKLEEKRKEAEERRKEARNTKRGEPVQQNQQTYQRQVTSPPVPAVSKHMEQVDRLKSPPIPTLRKKMDESPKEGKVERTPRREQTPKRNNKDEELPDTVRSVSPPVPAVSNRERDHGGERDVISALSAMRRQLQSEQRRVQSQLEKHRDYDPYIHNRPQGISRPSPQVDVFEAARHKGSVSVRREPINHQAADEFTNLRNRGGGSQSRQRLREQYPSEPYTNIALEAQQRALLKHQQMRLQEMERDSRNRDINLSNLGDLGRVSQSPAIPLDSSSAFIGIESGEAKLPSKEVPKEIYDLYSKPSPQPLKSTDPFGSTSSFDSLMIDRLAKKNKERNEVLQALQSDADSLVDADDILNQFLAKQSSPAPRSPSGKSDDLSLWLKPSEG